MALNMEIWDWDRVSKDDLISKLSIPLGQVANDDADGIWYDLPCEGKLEAMRQKGKTPQIRLRITVSMPRSVDTLDA